MTPEEIGAFYQLIRELREANAGLRADAERMAELANNKRDLLAGNAALRREAATALESLASALERERMLVKKLGNRCELGQDEGWARAETAEYQLTAAKADAATLAIELKYIVDAKRFDRSVFDDDTSFADWVQSRARAAIAKGGAG